MESLEPLVSWLGKYSTTFAPFAIHSPFFCIWAVVMVPLLLLLLELLLLELLLLELLLLILALALLMADSEMRELPLLEPPQLASRPVARRVARSAGPERRARSDRLAECSIVISPNRVFRQFG